MSEQLAKEQLVTALKYYKSFGLTKTKVVKGDEILDLYRILGAKPEVDETGKRKLTPYEILGVPPQFKNGGVEVPIVFAIKNKSKKIGKYTGRETTFIYKSNRVKEEDSILEQLKANYKKAILMGNEAEAQKFLDLINDVTGGKAEEFLDSFYDYTKFYRRMKKQLLLDIFSHFFLMYMMKKTKSSIIDKGIIKRGKVYKAYREHEEEYENDYVAELNQALANMAMPDAPVITNVSFEKHTDDVSNQINFKPQLVVASTASPVSDVKIEQPEPVVEEKEDNKINQKEVEPQEVAEDNFAVNFPHSLKDFFAGIENYAIEDDQEMTFAETFMMNQNAEELNASQNFEVSQEADNVVKESKEKENKEKNNKEKESEMFENQGFDFQA